ncbi:MAG: radical SAM protein [Pseudomonadota bacterium]
MKTLLLSSVFGPFGVDDAYGRRDNKMELMHNQVTREQGLFSFRFNHASYGLYFLAENVQAPTTVLDFPSLARFRREVAKGYDYVGISFIVPNFEKARLMVKIVREVSPSSQIVLGGHGTSVPGIEATIAYDHICQGEGIGFLRRLLGEPLDGPIRHPVMYSSHRRKIMGVPIPDGSAILIPGVGCANHCRFCATSAFFGSYIPYLPTGRSVFDACCAAEERLGTTDFGVLDENFLKVPGRAIELTELMEARGKRFTFGIFSSAETLAQLPDLDLLVRMGVTFLWMGVESRKEIYEKNRDVDFKALVADLRRRGIAVMASAILFLEHHDPQTIWEDVDFAIDLAPDYLQFMQLGPMPGTPLHTAYAAAGKLRDDVPWAEKHGQDRIWFHHPSFSRDETRTILIEAFRKDYEHNGASFLRQLETALMGFRYTQGHADPRVVARASSFLEYLRQLRPFVAAAAAFSENPASAALAAGVRDELAALFGPPTARERATSAAVLGLAAWDSARTRLFGDAARQPPVVLKKYRQEASTAPSPLPAAEGLLPSPAVGAGR